MRWGGGANYKIMLHACLLFQFIILPLFLGFPEPQTAQLVIPHKSGNSLSRKPAVSNMYFLPTNVRQLHRWWQHKAIIKPIRWFPALLFNSWLNDGFPFLAKLPFWPHEKLTNAFKARSVAAPHKCLLIAITDWKENIIHIVHTGRSATTGTTQFSSLVP